MSATEQIRVSPEVKSALEAEKEPGESYNETLERLIDERVARRRKAIREGAGVWEGTDGAEAARQVHDEMNEGLSPDP
jgi:predicted CopG family antitoxin